MNMINDFIEDLAYRYHDSKIIRKCFLPLYHKIHKSHQVMERLNNLKCSFDKHALSVLCRFDEVMTSNGYAYSLAFGTLLGAIREKGFIKHDLDIDVFVRIEDYSPLTIEKLNEAGFRISHQYSVDNDNSGKEDTLVKDGVQIDIFYYYPPIDGCDIPYSCVFSIFPNCKSQRQSIRKFGGLLPYRIEIPLSKTLLRVPFETLLLPVPENSRDFLSRRYGSDFMTPNPHWKSTETNDYMIPWYDKVGIYKENE